MEESILQAKKLKELSSSNWKNVLDIASSDSQPSGHRLRASFVTWRQDKPSQERIALYYLGAPPQECQLLSKHREWFDAEKHREFQNRWDNQSDPPDQLIRIANILVQDPNGREAVLKHKANLVRLLLQQNPSSIMDWINGFSSVQKDLLPVLVDEFRTLPESETSLSVNAANLIASFGTDSPRSLQNKLRSPQASHFKFSSMA